MRPERTLGDVAGAALGTAGAEGIRHEAFVYFGDVGFLGATRDFVLAGLAADEDVLVVVPEPGTSLLRSALGRAVKRVAFYDMAEVGKNPACIIPVWQEFVEWGVERGRSVRGIGEPVWPGRAAPELGECALHEALLNEAFAGPPSWRLRCLYEAGVFEPRVADGVWQTHPVVVDGGLARSSSPFRASGHGVAPPGEPGVDPFAAPLPDLGPPRAELAFGPRDLGLIRAAAAAAARAEGLNSDRVGDVELAVHEVATNSVRHGGGQGVARFWSDGGLICEVSDAGLVVDRLVGRRRPELELGGGRGLWLVNQLCDLVQLRSAQTGTTVRMFVRG
ncbi:sensor histidine kinase [Frankia sp. AgB32]|uniref:anti-sigma factor RsbA family regulatory protein n=1 Tax=Frankia sp. AgB32 TaxID=631119 RepID=UPI00200F8E55|nr:sensor histidine kinase [Frankia sp. AgB32]MCK9897929.1 sensor histidine kinase [Frankia sp. AgB32]